MTLIELLFVALALLTGLVAAGHAYSTWGVWAGVGGFIVGSVSFIGVVELLGWLLSPARPRCECGNCGVDDFRVQRDVDGKPTINVYACGRMYRVGEDRQLHPLALATTGDPLVREAERLDGKGTEVHTGGEGAVRFVVRTPKAAAAGVLERTREVLRIVNAASRSDWPSEEQWKRVLPMWFLDQFESEKSQAESEAWLARWDRLSLEEKQREERDKPWSLRNWLHWLHPDQRVWFWWDGAIVKDDQLLVALEVDSWPYPWGAFAWLIKAAGGVEVSPEGDAAGGGPGSPGP